MLGGAGARVAVALLLGVAVTACSGATPHPALPSTPPFAHSLAAPPSGASGSVTAVQAVTRQVAFALGGRQIWRTHDAAGTWQLEWHGSYQLEAVDALSPSTAFAVGDGHLLATEDGQGWHEVTQDGTVVSAVHFVDPLFGVGLVSSAGQAVEVATTTDGGRSWGRLPTPAAPLAASACSRSRFWLATVNTLWFSEDGGVRWTKRLSVPDAELAGMAVRNEAALLQATSGCHVLVRFSPGQGAASKQPWSLDVVAPSGRRTDPVLSFSSDYPPAVSVIDPGTVALAGVNPAADPGPTPFVVSRSGYGGRQGTAPVREPTALSFVDPATGYVVGLSVDGQGTVVAYTADGGRHWRESLRSGT